MRTAVSCATSVAAAPGFELSSLSPAASTTRSRARRRPSHGPRPRAREPGRRG